jgi:hypothetical protein
MTGKNLALIAALALFVTSARAQKNEFAVSVGGMFTSATTTECNNPCLQFPRIEVKTAPALAFQGTFARRIEDFHAATLYFELPLLGIPGRQPSTVTGFTANYSSIFVPPSLKVKVRQGRAISPFFSVGGGFAYLNGNNNGRNFTGSGQFGGGADFKTRIPFLAIRGEVRDFFSGRPAAENLVAGPDSDSRQHNLFTGVGAVLTF